jgi:hypothetical protein
LVEFARTDSGKRMNRISRILRRFARVYLVAMGGGFALVTSLGLIVNVKAMFQHTDKSDVQYLRQSGLVLLISTLALVAGVAIHKYRWWSLPLAGGIGVLVIGYSVSDFSADPLGAHTFTILIPMAAIVFWASLPATWLEFKRQGPRNS